MLAQVVSAIKHCVVERPHPVDAALASHMLAFLSAMSDEDRHVRRAAVVSLSAAAHAKPALVADHLPALLPALFAQTAVREDLIRVVDLGPFKHRVSGWAWRCWGAVISVGILSHDNHNHNHDHNHITSQPHITVHKTRNGA